MPIKESIERASGRAQEREFKRGRAQEKRGRPEEPCPVGAC